MRFVLWVGDFDSTFEIGTVMNFLHWQDMEFNAIQSNKDVVRLSKGKSRFHVQCINSDKNVIGSFNTFHELYKWFQDNGCVKC